MLPTKVNISWTALAQRTNISTRLKKYPAVWKTKLITFNYQRKKRGIQSELHFISTVDQAKHDDVNEELDRIGVF